MSKQEAKLRKQIELLLRDSGANFRHPADRANFVTQTMWKFDTHTTKLLKEQLIMARIDELNQHFLDRDELCMVDSITKKPLTVRQRKDQLYEELEHAKKE